MSDRMLRVNSVLREVLADEIERMSDERLEMVSVTAVDTSPDLRQAVVYIDVLETDRQEPALAALERAASRLQAVIGTQVRMKYTPMLTFRIDPGVTGGERIDAILRELRNDGGGNSDTRLESRDSEIGSDEPFRRGGFEGGRPPSDEVPPLPGSARTPPNASLGGEMGDSGLGSDGPFPGGGSEGGRPPSYDAASLGGEMGDSGLGSDGPFPGGGSEGGRPPSYDAASLGGEMGDVSSPRSEATLGEVARPSRPRRRGNAPAGDAAPLPGSAGTPPNASLGGETSRLPSFEAASLGGETSRPPSFDTEHR